MKLYLSFMSIIILNVCGFAQQAEKSPRYIYTGKTDSNRVTFADTIKESETSKDDDLKTFFCRDLLVYDSKDIKGSKETFVKIVLLDPKSQHKHGYQLARQTIGFISFDYLNSSNPRTKFIIKFLKATLEKDGQTNWYVIVSDNEEYDIVKVCAMKKTLGFNSRVYNTYIVLAKYGTKSKPAYETAFLCTRE